jgi:hypothetical protein
MQYPFVSSVHFVNNVISAFHPLIIYIRSVLCSPSYPVTLSDTSSPRHYIPSECKYEKDLTRSLLSLNLFSSFLKRRIFSFPLRSPHFIPYAFLLSLHSLLRHFIIHVGRRIALNKSPAPKSINTC